MKIAVVVTGGLHPSGRDQVVPSWLALFSELATTHEIHAFALRHLHEAQSYKLLGFTVHDLGRPAAAFGLTRWAQARALTRALSAHGPFDLVHGLWGDPAGQLAVRCARRFGIPSLVTMDSGEFVSIPAIDYGSQRTARGRRVIQEACGASRIHVCTQFMANKAAQYGIQPAVIPLTSVTSGARAERAARAEPGGQHFRTELGGRHFSAAGESLKLLQVASLSRVKNQRMLIDALAVVRQSIDARLDLVGEDTLDGELQRHAIDKGVAESVRFHGFALQDRLAAIFADADLYVQSSLHEAAGVSVLEAAAAGLPIVGTRVGYIADWAADRALATDTIDASSMAQAILALHADPSRARAMAASAQAWALEHHASWATDRFAALYREVAGR
jgi:glycosyltransferase involved in cell wall biosynthesis